MDGDDSAEIDVNEEGADAGENAADVADMAMEQQDGAAANAEVVEAEAYAEAPIREIAAVAAAHENNRVRLENMIEEVDTMFEEVNELMVDVAELMRHASELTEAMGNDDPTVASLEMAEAAPASSDIDNLAADQQPDRDIVDEDAHLSDHDASPSGSESSDISVDSPESEDDSDGEAFPRWTIPQNRMRRAVDMLVSQARSSDGGIAGLLNRDNFLQRVRSMVFSQERRSRASDEASVDVGDGGGPNTNDVAPAGLPPLPPPPPPIDIDMEFDTNLPAEHSYFGTNLNRVPGVDYLEVGSTHRMLIFLHQHILFPGEVLPFMIDGSIIDDEIQDSGRDGVIFGVGFPLMQPPDDNPHKLYGVTCQIYEKGEGGRQMVFYKSRALQRIVINCDDIQGPPQYIARNPTTKCYSKVKILPEYFLPEPLKCIDMGSMNRFRDIPSMRDKFRRYQMASTPWPMEACEEYSFEDIVEKARKKLEQHKIDTMPKCPIQLSFWLVRNLHLTEKMMRLTFLTDSVNTRLKLIGGTLKEESLFYCRYCNSSLAYCSDLFAMSKHGVQTQYCNSAGYIHETNTVYRVMAHAIGYSGEPSTEFSWFPGYQWHIILCKFCAQHVGWEFKAVEPNLAPKVFFGLAGSSVRIGKTSERTPVNGNTFVVRNLLRLVSRDLE
ncbi:protein cereblon homolog isoform X2 [Scaptodrosophila lebanonensis]|uniref:Protein cereblon n=1 Tax=Drosophila lebanonensis TaxID=7225 RepID=A0A6J2TM97_DROLE|nr:protein cereblon homolog isoform X2 [Scaptodrosophila lebanonensis]